MSSEAKNLEAIARAIEQHDRNCEYPAIAVAMNPFELERLGWDTIKGLPIHADPNLETGRFEVVCEGDEQELVNQEAVEAVSDQVVPVQ